jgi:hypothetical protein
MSGLKLSNGNVIPPDDANIIMSGSGVDIDYISTSAQLTSLSPEQINSLILRVNGLISTNTDSIAKTAQIIIGLQESIDNPISGYQYIYDSTVRAYQISISNYNRQSTLVNSASLRLSSLYSSLSSVIDEEKADLSTLIGYSLEYSTFLEKININNDILSKELHSYYGLSTSMHNYVYEYTTAFNELLTTTDSSIASTLSTTAGNSIIGEHRISTFLHSTMQTISTMIFFSTQYQDDINNYNTDALYSSLKSGIFATIDQLWAEQQRITGAISEYDTRLFQLEQNAISEYGNVQTNIIQYYTDKNQQIRNQILQVKYSVQEYEGFFGYVTSQCMITKLQIYNTLDLFIYQTTQTPDTSKMILIQNYSTDQNILQSIIDLLNPLKLPISDIYETFEPELQLRSDFINVRKRMSLIELDVYMYPTKKDSYSVEYASLAGSNGQLMQKITSINTSIQNRVEKITTSFTNIFDNIRSKITSLNTTYPMLAFVYPRDIYPIRNTNPNIGYSSNTEPPFNLDPTEFQIRGLEPLIFP